jgi:hypothetical protein
MDSDSLSNRAYQSEPLYIPSMTSYDSGLTFKNPEAILSRSLPIKYVIDSMGYGMPLIASDL